MRFNNNLTLARAQRRKTIELGFLLSVLSIKAVYPLYLYKSFLRDISGEII
jgi:hypothetical protein